MKKIVLLALILCTGLRLFATDVIPYTEVVSFSVRTAGTGGGGTLTVQAEGTVSTGHNVVDTSPESTFVFARLRPGRDYTMNFTWAGTGPADAISSYSLNFIAPAGYELLVNDVPRDMWGATVGTVNGNQPLTLRIRPTAGSTPDGHSDFSGISLGKAVKWAVGLGSLRTGRGAGGISFRELDLSSSPASRDRLYLTSDLPGNGQISVIRDGASNQVLRQVVSPIGPIDLVDDAGGGYWLKFYTWGQISWNGTLYTFTGSPWKTIRVESPATNQLKITETEGSVSRVSQLALTSGSVASGTYVWTLQEGDGTTVLRTTVHTSTDAGTSRTVIEDIRTGGTSGTIVAKNRYHYQDYAWGEELKEVENGYSLSNSFTTTYGYYTDNTVLGNYRQIKWVTDTTGNWTGYERYNDWDKRGRTKYVFKPWNSLPVAPTLESGTISSSDGLIEAYTYVADWTGRHGRMATRTINVYTPGGNAQLSKTEWTHGDVVNSGVHEPRETATIASFSDVSASLGGSSQNLREDAAADFIGRPWVVLSSNGTQSSWSYSRGTFDNGSKVFTMGASGDHWREIKLNGAKDSGGGAESQTTFAGQTFEAIWLVPYKSTAEVTVRIGIGAVYRTENHVYTGSGNWQLVAYADNIFDGLGRPTQAAASNGAITTYTYGSLNRLASNTDSYGVQTDYTYDELGRVKTAKKVGAAASSPYSAQTDLTTAKTYDGAGRVTQTVLSNSGDSETITTLAVYDLAGRVTSQTPPGLGATTTSYSPSTRTTTTTAPAPDGGTTVRITQLDGRLASVTGTAVVAQYYTYGFETDGRTWERVDTGSSTSPRWAKSWADWLGRSTESRSPTFSAITAMGDAISQNFYDAATGTLIKTKRVDAAGNRLYADTLYEYNTLGEIVRSGRDVDNGGTLVLASMDRITDADARFENYSSAWWSKQTSTIYPLNNSASAFTSTIARTRLTGFSGSLRSESQATDAEGNVSTRTTAISGKTATTTTTAPGMVNSASTVVYNGLAVGSTAADGLTSLAQFDNLGRAWKSIDPRGLVITTTYYTGTGLVQAVTDSAGKTVGITAYDTSGRVASQADALGAINYTAYSPRGVVIRQWGTGTYPVEYEYDSTYGDRTKMRTWRTAPVDFTSATAFLPANYTYPATTGDVTEWTNDQATALQWKKKDADGKVVEFDYNVRGQTTSRKWARKLTAVGHTTTPLTTTYGYDPATGELLTTTYNDSVESIERRTPGVTYTYNRAGQVHEIQDGTTVGTEKRTFAYAATAPWRLDYEALPTFFDSRRLTRLYESTTGVTGSFGGYTKGTVKGRGIGFDLGVSSDPDRDLHQQYTASNLGRFVGVTGQAAIGTAQDFVYAYESGARLLDGYTAGSFSVSRDFESNRDLPSRIESKWSTTSLTRFDFAYNDRYERLTAKQSGTAFADYYTGTAYSAVYNSYNYNLRGELQTSAMYAGNTPSTTPAPTDEIPGRRFEFRYDELGNRKTAGATGSAASADDVYTVNALNQYTEKENNFVRFFGTKKLNATVAAPGITVGVKDRGWAADFVPGNGGGPAKGTTSIYSALIGGGAGGLDYIRLDTRAWFAAQRVQVMDYDADGNLIFDGVFTYTWNAENQLVRVTSALTSGAGFTRLRLDFKYDYMNRRTEKRVTNIDTSTETIARRFIYDGWNLVAELDANTPATILRSYAWGLDLTGDFTKSGGIGALLRMTNYVSGSPGTSYYPTYDGNGNVVSLVNATNGNLAAVYEYDPFGNYLRNEVIDSAVTDNPFRFSTKYTDVETGWAYYGLRYYSPTLGRFLNQDPIAEQGGLNLYGFCGNNGVNRWDYLGMVPQDIYVSAPGDDEFDRTIGVIRGTRFDSGSVTVMGGGGFTAWDGQTAGQFVGAANAYAQAQYQRKMAGLSADLAGSWNAGIDALSGSSTGGSPSGGGFSVNPNVPGGTISVGLNPSSGGGSAAPRGPMYDTFHAGDTYNADGSVNPGGDSYFNYGPALARTQLEGAILGIQINYLRSIESTAYDWNVAVQYWADSAGVRGIAVGGSYDTPESGVLRGTGSGSVSFTIDNGFAFSGAFGGKVALPSGGPSFSVTAGGSWSQLHGTTPLQFAFRGTGAAGSNANAPTISTGAPEGALPSTFVIGISRRVGNGASVNAGVVVDPARVAKNFTDIYRGFTGQSIQ